MAGKRSFIKKTITILILALTAAGGYWVYVNAFKNNVHLKDGNAMYIFIKTGATMEDVLDELYSKDIIEDHRSFEWTAKEMDLADHIVPGKYRIGTSMSNRSIVKMIKNGKQEKVKLFLNSQIRTKEEFIKYISGKLEIEESELEEYCSNDEVLHEKYGINGDNFMSFIVPHDYEVKWTTHIDSLFPMLEKSYRQLWTKEKKAKAKAIGYTIPEIVTIASIVQNESGIKSEQQKIAGVYINRLKQDMKLQADPTIVFANGNFEVQRVLAVDKEIDSPYNTYKYKGLPPGPICLVYPSTVEAVLNYTKHSYIYFCAKPDFSGYSNYTNDYSVHMKNASAYQSALNNKGIKR